MRILIFAVALMLPSCGLSIGPQTEETVVLVKDGQPGVVAENVTVAVKFDTAGAKQIKKQDIGGWAVMPKQHFDALMTQLNKNADLIAELRAELAREKVPVDVKPK